MSHRNARLTPEGASSSSSVSGSKACPLPTWPGPWGSHANAPIAGCGASTRKARLDLGTARAAPTAPTPRGPVLWQHGSGATTPSAPTVLLGDDRRSVGCHEPDGRVQLVPKLIATQTKGRAVRR